MFLSHLCTKGADLWLSDQLELLSASGVSNRGGCPPTFHLRVSEVVCSVSAGTAAGYYIGEQAKYYTGGVEPTGVWFSPNRDFGLEDGAPIDDAIFQQLHAGYSPDGKPLRQSANALRPGTGAFDLTFSAPKSVSILWALGADDLRLSIERAQECAVREALGVLNDHAAFSRRGHGGQVQERVCISGALFQHGESRPVKQPSGDFEADPQLHTHSTLLNCARRSDGSWGALDGRHFFAWKMAMGAIYRRRLALELRGAGLAIAASAETGLFEVGGIPKALIKEFSGRRTQIVADLAESGLTPTEAPELAARVTRTSRRAKTARQCHGDRHERWRTRATSFGHSPQAIVEMCLQFGRRQEKEQAMDPKVSIDGTLARLTEQESVFLAKDVYRVVASVALASGDTTPVRILAQSVLTSPNVLCLREDKLGRRVYSTREVAAIEEDIIRLASEGGRAPFPAVRSSDVASSCQATSLSDEQKEAVDSVTRPTRLAVLEGKAGAGKSTTLTAVASVYRRRGYRVIGSAAAWRVATQLAKDCEIECRATDAWLAGKNFLDRKTVLIVDEAGQLSSRQIHKLLMAAALAKSKIIFCGDPNQLQAIGAGPGYRFVAEQVQIARLDSIQRQKEGWLRDAVIAFSEGRSEQALRGLNDHGGVHWANSHKAAITALVERWAASGESSLLLAKSNKEVEQLNSAARLRMRECGRLGKDAAEIRARRNGRDAAAMQLAVGDRIRFQRRNDELGVINGTLGEVRHVESDGAGHARLDVSIDSRILRFSTRQVIDEQGRVLLTHAYASTIYSAQGATVDQAFVLGGPQFSRNEAYVACSRARSETQIVVSRNVVDAAIRSRLPADVRRGIVLRDDLRLQALGEYWSREQIKERALMAHVPPERPRDRDRPRSRSLELE